MFTMLQYSITHLASGPIYRIASSKQTPEIVFPPKETRDHTISEETSYRTPTRSMASRALIDELAVWVKECRVSWSKCLLLYLTSVDPTSNGSPTSAKQRR